MTMDLNSDRYLLADWSNVQPGAVVTSDTVTGLYLVQSSGNRQQLYSLRGGSFISAQFSPDGRYVLLATYTPLSRTVEKQGILLIDLERANPPRKLGEVIVQIDPGLRFNTVELSWLTAAFVDGGPFDGKVLLAEYDVDHYHLRLFDTATTGEALVDVEVPTGNRIHWTVFPGSSDLMLIAGEDNSTGFVRTQVNSVRFVVLSSNGSAKLTKATIGANTFLENAAVFSDRLIYSTFAYGDTQVTHAVFSLPLDHFNIKGRRPETTFKQSFPVNDFYWTTYGAYNFRPDLFAYVAGNDLHAQTYPGDVDVVLEHGVTRLYDLASFSADRRSRLR
jgi:hypothetical protein